MNGDFDFYLAQAQLQADTPDWLSSLQQKAVVDFNRLDFPTRRDEDWKYTPLTHFFKHRFDRAVSQDVNVTSQAPYTISVIDGVVSMQGDWHKQLPAGVIVMPLRQAIDTHSKLVAPYLGRILQHTHGFQALNTAIMQTGVFIYLPKEVRLKQPLIIMHQQTKADTAVHCRHLLIADAGSEAVVTETYEGSDALSYFSNVVTEVSLAAHASLTHYKMQNESKKAYHIGHIAVKQHESSRFISHSLSYGGCLVRSDMTLDLCEARAFCSLNGLYVPTDGQHVDHHTLINHKVADCASEQDYRGILIGKSQAVFNGRVVVAQDAQKTQAKQQNKNLLLSASAEIDTKPQLEIFADDVVCTHGATVGQLDEDALFYMASRGIPREEASRFLVEAFAENNVSRIGDEVNQRSAQEQLARAMEDVHD